MIKDASTSKFLNPINTAGADPYVMLHSDGYYYFTRTLRNRIDIWKSRTLTGIDLGERKTVWKKPANLKDIWAPEIHHYNGKWYIYYTANTGCGDQCRGVYVLENASADPLKGEWVEKGKVNTQYSGLDGSIFEHKGLLYFLYGAYGDWSGKHGSAVAIAPMSNPWTLKGENVILTYPEYDWEKKGMDVNEGTVILKRNGKIFLVYSASACWEDDYAIGMLTTSENSNLLDQKSWSKSTVPVFSKSEENGVYNPGHNSFVKSKDGKEDWIVYHGNSGPGQGCTARPTRVQKFTWNDDGTPNLGVPLIGPIEVPSGEYRFEAEHGTMYNTKLNEVEDVSNKKTVSLNNKNGHLLIEDVNVPEAGTYTMTVKYSNDASADATNDVHVNGRPASILSYPNTGNRKFKEVTMKVDLNKGYNNTIKFMKKEHIVEIDYIEISGEVPFLIESGKDYKLINPNGGKALDIMDDGTNNVRTWESDDSSTSQIWKLVELGQGTYKIINPESGNVLSLGNDQTGQSVSVNIQKWKDSASQKWEIAHVGQGYFKLINLYNGEALDVSGASIDSGANVGTWENLPGGIAQMWLLYVLK
ncbi:family 43 glycosylhydrolase [Oceanobacillus bengalensis]|uniref:Carbohydrate-binding protein n=1 Tax=Oceanobacillus bengalensis TaxID=1435466 RepID=A0A494YTU4_9BACI|nr:carbohydrate-binding protein [Oceanobacillus bengalensis]